MPTPTSLRRPKPRALALGIATVAIAGLVALLAGAGDRPAGSDPDSDRPSSDRAGFELSVTSGTAGQQIAITSLDPCPEPPSDVTGPYSVEVTLRDPRQGNDGGSDEVFGRQFAIADDGSWTARLPIPITATAGPTYVHVQCLGRDPARGLPGPFHDYPVEVELMVRTP